MKKRSKELWLGCRVLVVAVALVGSARAQVSTDTKSLDELAPSTPASAAKPRHVTHHVRRPAAPVRKLPSVPMAAAPPANPVIAPQIFVMPTHRPPPPPPVPVVAGAIGTAVGLAPKGLRLTFGPGSADLNQAMLDQLLTAGHLAMLSPNPTVSIIGWAQGSADDPSTARRLSLDRALAARAVMIQTGLLSDRIRVVAKGNTDSAGGPPDRVDLQFTN